MQNWFLSFLDQGAAIATDRLEKSTNFTDLSLKTTLLPPKLANGAVTVEALRH